VLSLGLGLVVLERKCDLNVKCHYDGNEIVIDTMNICCDFESFFSCLFLSADARRLRLATGAAEQSFDSVDEKVS